MKVIVADDSALVRHLIEAAVLDRGAEILDVR